MDSVGMSFRGNEEVVGGGVISTINLIEARE